MSRIRLAAFVFVFVVSYLPVATALDIPSVASTKWEGEERTNLKVHKLGRALFLGTATLVIDQVNEYVYNGSDSFLTYEGSVDQSKRKLRFGFPSGNLPFLEEAIKAGVLELAKLLDVELGNVTVEVDEDSIVAKGRVKTRRNDNSFIRQIFKAKFELTSALGTSKGGIRVKTVLPQTGVVPEP